MPGERFSELYSRPEALSPDSGRARYRVGTLFRDLSFQGQMEPLAVYVGRYLGVALPGDGRYPSSWLQFTKECRIADFLDAVTLVYRYFFWHVSDKAATWWLETVRKIFGEEHLAYEIDDIGGVHPRVDQEFQRNIASAVAGLQSERHHAARELFERALRHLCARPPNYKQALRATWSAVDALFGIMFPGAQLSADDFGSRLRPVVERTYNEEPTAQRAALEMLNGFQPWIDAAMRFRHQPGAPECAQPPADVAVLSISCGTALLRWLIDIDERSRA